MIYRIIFVCKTCNDFYESVYDKIKKYINDYYGEIKYFSIVNKETCGIRIADKVTAICIIRLENHCFTEYNKDNLAKTCENILEKAIATEETNIEYLEKLLKDSKKRN